MEKKWYFTFGQNHAHSYGGRTYDKDCVVEIEAANMGEARDKMWDAFDAKWASQYDEIPDMHYFPRGIFKL